MTLKVIGTGFGRTGTDSMREALDMLGFGPCHHMFEVNANEEQKRLWRAFVKGTPMPWNPLFEGYASCIDWPSAHYWPELVSAYPNARVILTWRSPESWWESFEKPSWPACARAPTRTPSASRSSATRCSAASRATAPMPWPSMKPM